MFVGSANFTTRGLKGQNRELMLASYMTERELDDLLAQLPAARAEGFVGVPPGVAPEEDPWRAPTLIFRPDPGQRCSQTVVRGTLFFDGDRVDPGVVVSYGGGSTTIVIEPNQPSSRLEVRMARLWADFTRNGRPGMLDIRIEADESFWRFDDAADPLYEKPDPEWVSLLALLTRREPSPHNPPAENSRPPAPLAEDDAFRIPLEQRLVLIARHRERAKGVVDVDRLEAILNGDRIQASVAEAVLGLGHGQSPLLRALQEASRGEAG